jgi:streptogramin lyase
MTLRTMTLVLLAVLTAAAQSAPPQLNYQVDPNWPQLPAGWNLQETPGIAVDANRHVYVFHRGENPIIEFDPSGKVVRSWGEGMFIRPHAVRIDPQGNIWTVDNDTHQILKMNPQGRVVMVLGRKGQSGETEINFNRPTDVAFGANGDIYISDGYGNSRVVKFTKDGQFIKAWGKKGAGEGEFNLPHSVALDKQGRVYIGDRENYRLQIFDADGKFLQQWKHVGSPWGLVITPDQFIYISDGHANRILKLNIEGEILGTLSSKGKLPGQVDYAHHLAVDSQGAIYVAEILNWRAQKFVPR